MTPPSSQWRTGDALEALRDLPDRHVGVTVTSPPYWGLRRYTDDPREIGRGSLGDYLDDLAAVTAELRRVTRDDGVLWLNIADTAVGSGGRRRGGEGPFATPGPRPRGRAGLRAPQWAGVPARVALQTQEQGWLLRSWIAWDRGRTRPESSSGTRRPGVQWESILLFAKGATYAFDAAELTEPGDVWRVPPTSRRHGHPAAFPSEIARRCLAPVAGHRPLVLDPFAGSGTTCVVAARLGLDSLGVDLDPEQAETARARLAGIAQFAAW